MGLCCSANSTKVHAIQLTRATSAKEGTAVPNSTEIGGGYRHLGSGSAEVDVDKEGDETDHDVVVITHNRPVSLRPVSSRSPRPRLAKGTLLGPGSVGGDAEESAASGDSFVVSEQSYARRGSKMLSINPSRSLVDMLPVSPTTPGRFGVPLSPSRSDQAVVTLSASELRERGKSLTLAPPHADAPRQQKQLSPSRSSRPRLSTSTSDRLHRHQPGSSPSPARGSVSRRHTIGALPIAQQLSARHVSPGSRPRRRLVQFESKQGASFSDVASYVPTVVIEDSSKSARGERPSSAGSRPPQALVARATSLEAAVVFVDMSGFTRLTEHLQAMDGGVEAMSRVLNDYFAQLIGVISRHGGDVVKFAGDALLVIWSSACSKQPYPLTVHALHAASCLQDLHASFCDFEIVPGISVSLHSALTAGLVLGAHVGGVGGRWEFILDSHEKSRALDNLWAAMQHASPGDIVLTADVCELFEQEPSAVCSVETSAIFGSGCVRLLELFVNSSNTPSPAPLKRSRIPNKSAANRMTPAAVTQRLRGYVPKYVLERLDQRQARWLAELRTLTVMFIKLPRFSLSKPAELDEFQKLLHHIMRISNAQLGTVRQIITDDKGTVVILVFGLESPAGGALRGLRAALLLQRSHCMSTRSIFIGVSTGKLFCGNLGSVRRREYVFIGDAVNTAARLMSITAKMHDTTQSPRCVTVCDERTRCAALRTCDDDNAADTWFDTMGEMRLKGKQLPVAVWRPRFAILGTDVALFSPLSTDDAKYTLATTLLAPQLEALRSDGSPLLLLAGSPSHALQVHAVSHLYHSALAQGTVVVAASVPHSEMSSTGFVIGRLTMQCLWLILATPPQDDFAYERDADFDTDSSALTAIVESLVEFIGTHHFFSTRDPLPPYTKGSPLPMPPDMLRALALLNGVVPGLALPVDESLAALSSQQREHATVALIGRLLNFAATHSNSSVQVIVDNAEYVDAFSISALLECLRVHSTVRLVLCVGSVPGTDHPLIHAMQRVSLTSVLDHGGTLGDSPLPTWLLERLSPAYNLGRMRRISGALPMTPMRSVSGRRHGSGSPQTTPTTALEQFFPSDDVAPIEAGFLLLRPLDLAGVERAITLQLGVSTVDPRVVQLCLDDSCGSVDNLAHLLASHVEAGDLVVDSAASACTLHERFSVYDTPLPRFISLSSGSDYSACLAPEVRSRVSSCLQALGPSHLLVLKSAAVIGHYFTRELLMRVFPVHESQQRNQVPELLDELVQSQVIKPCRAPLPSDAGGSSAERPAHPAQYIVAHSLLGTVPTANTCYHFAEWTTQVVLYEGLTLEYRSKLHSKVARCVVEQLEHLPGVQPDPSRLYLSRLATFHWSRSPISVSTSDLNQAVSCAVHSEAGDLVQKGDLDLAVAATWSGRYVFVPLSS